MSSLFPDRYTSHERPISLSPSELPYTQFRSERFYPFYKRPLLNLRPLFPLALPLLSFSIDYLYPWTPSSSPTLDLGSSKEKDVLPTFPYFISTYDLRRIVVSHPEAPFG